MPNTFRPTYQSAAKFLTVTGWGVCVNCREPGEDMWESIYYHRHDLTIEQADHLVKRIDDHRSFNLDYWYWYPSACAQYGFMHDDPKS